MSASPWHLIQLPETVVSETKVGLRDIEKSDEGFYNEIAYPVSIRKGSRLCTILTLIIIVSGHPTGTADRE